MLVYIASLPHSGSTLLSLLLARQPGVVALGEVRLQIEKLRRDPAKAAAGMCGCRARIRDCALWGPFMAQHLPDATPVQDLQLVARIMRDIEGRDVLMVDASKIREPLGELAAARSLPVKVIHLGRDWRSWVVSAVDLRRRKGKQNRPGWWLGFEGARRWVRENRKLDRAIAASGFPSMRIGYEELVLGAPRAWPALRGFLGLPAGDVPLDVAAAHNHIFSGNRMREDDARSKVAYDRHWLGRNEWRACSAFFPGMPACNRRWVYSHGFAGDGHLDELRRLADSQVCGAS